MVRGVEVLQRGSIEIKSTELVIQEVYRSMLIQQLIPAKLRKWPSEGPSIILFNKITQGFISQMMIQFGNNTIGKGV